MIDTTGRAAPTVHIVRFFAYDHLREDLQPIACMFHEVAAALIAVVPDSPELTAALRKLLESKDCAVRAAL